MIEVPLQTIDNFMLELHLGHILIGTLVLVILGTLPLKSMKILGINIMLMGALFMLTPVSAAGDMVIFRLVGVGLIIVGPMLYVAGR